MPELEKNFPKKFDTYFEPFLGGGAVMFNLLSKHPNMKCHVSDLNSDLILTYVAIRDKVGELIESLENHSKKYQKNSSQYYYKVRESEPVSQIEKVSKLIFLNKTCFNGLYRVNSKGKFNVPLGRDFVYFDPPYQPVSNTANFTSYTNKSFTDDDLQRLANLAEKLDSMGCKVLLSNSKSQIVENSFSSSKWNIKEIRVNRAINSDSKKRTGHYEFLIKNY